MHMHIDLHIRRHIHLHARICICAYVYVWVMCWYLYLKVYKHIYILCLCLAICIRICLYLLPSTSPSRYLLLFLSLLHLNLNLNLKANIHYSKAWIYIRISTPFISIPDTCIPPESAFHRGDADGLGSDLSLGAGFRKEGPWGFSGSSEGAVGIESDGVESVANYDDFVTRRGCGE